MVVEVIVMYKVYIVVFKELNAIYVGCSNELRRRKDQHNGNAKNPRTRFARFMADHNIVLSESDLIILNEFRDRSKALKLEKNTIKAFNKSDMDVLNDVYSLKTTFVHKLPDKINNSEHWVVVDFQEHTAIETFSLKKYCDDNGLFYKTMHCTAEGKSHAHKNRYIAFKLDKWLAISEIEKFKYISGDFLKEINQTNYENHIKSASKSYIVTFPDGHEETVVNLDKFARDHKINDGNLHASITNNRTASGYKARKLD